MTLVKDKIGALDDEITRFKRENQRVKNLKEECERQLQKFQEDVRDFEERRNQEIEDFNAFK